MISSEHFRVNRQEEALSITVSYLLYIHCNSKQEWGPIQSIIAFKLVSSLWCKESNPKILLNGATLQIVCYFVENLLRPTALHSEHYGTLHCGSSLPINLYLCFYWARSRHFSDVTTPAAFLKPALCITFHLCLCLSVSSSPELPHSIPLYS